MGSLHAYVALIENIRGLLSLDWELSLAHTLREGNSCANFLAKLGTVSAERWRVCEEPTVGMASLLEVDARWVAFVHP